MWRANLKSTWSQVLAGVAAALGFGTLFGEVARAEVTQYHSAGTIPERSARATSRVDEVIVRIERDSVHISQDGSSFEELRLGDTPEAAHLKKLLRDAGAGQSIPVPIGAMIVASGGGGHKAEKPKDSDGK
jgi:hypothetical protein